MKKQSYRHTGVHKNLLRLDFLTKCNPAIAPKLREILETHKVKEKGNE